MLKCIVLNINNKKVKPLTLYKTHNKLLNIK